MCTNDYSSRSDVLLLGSRDDNLTFIIKSIQIRIVEKIEVSLDQCEPRVFPDRFWFFFFFGRLMGYDRDTDWPRFRVAIFALVSMIHFEDTQD